MIELLRHVKDRIAGKIPAGKSRSGQWPTVRKIHLLSEPTCRLCGGSAKLEVHHIEPFHLHPGLELDPNNLITLCEELKDGLNCHLAFGHLGNFKSYNTSVVLNATVWAKKIKERP